MTTNAQFSYIAYRREGYKDAENFRRQLESELAEPASMKDIVVDFTGFKVLSSSEIGALVRVLNRLQGTTRSLRIVVTPSIGKTLESTNLARLPNLVIYPDQEAFLASVQRSPP